jgi:cell wall-associated NlpC family hydrolase
MTHAPVKILAIAACVCLFSLCALAGGAPALVTNDPSPPTTSTIPTGLLPVLEAAATNSPCGLHWTLLAAVATTESDFDPTAVSGAGAEGLFQFEPATFAEYADPVPAGGAVPASPFDPVDAAYAAARYLCSLGVVGNPTLALVAYNCGNTGPACQAASAGYAEQVLAIAAGYTALSTDGAKGVQSAAVADAESQIGTPYAFGGAGPHSGFDCSGLVVWAYGLAGVVVPRTANDQWQDEPHIPVARLVAGDLVFFGAGGDAEHVGIYIGNNAMVDAPREGADVRIDTFTDVVGAVWGSQTLLGATSVSTTDPAAV